MSRATEDSAPVVVEWDVSKPITLSDLTGAKPDATAAQAPPGLELADLRLTFPSGKTHQGIYNNVVAITDELYVDVDDADRDDADTSYVGFFKLNYPQPKDVEGLREVVSRFEQEWGVDEASAAELEDYLDRLDEIEEDGTISPSDVTRTDRVRSFAGASYGSIETGLVIQVTSDGFSPYTTAQFNPVPVTEIDWDLSEPVLASLGLSFVWDRYAQESTNQSPIPARITLPDGNTVELSVISAELYSGSKTFDDGGAAGDTPIERVVLTLPELPLSDAAEVVDTLDDACGLEPESRSALADAADQAVDQGSLTSPISVPLGSTDDCGESISASLAQQTGEAIVVSLIIDF